MYTIIIVVLKTVFTCRLDCVVVLLSLIHIWHDNDSEFHVSKHTIKYVKLYLIY